MSARAAFRHPDFRVYQAARFLGTIAMQMQAMAIGWQVYATTHRAIDLGYVGLAEFIPTFGLALVAGAVADRFDRKKIIVLTTLGVTACSLLFLFMSVTHLGGVLGIYATIVVFGVFRAFSAPASQAFLPGLVPKEDFPNAVALMSSLWQVATILGPPLGGLLYSAVGAGAVYAASAVLSLVTATLVASVHPKYAATVAVQEKKGPQWGTFLAGIRYVRQHRVLLGSISLDLFAVLFGGVSALLPVFASEVLRTPPWGLGVLSAAPGVGAAIMGGVVAQRPLKRRAGATMFACVAIFGLATIAFALSRSFVVSVLALLVIGASDMVSVVVRQTLVQLKTPHEMRGRVSAVNMMFIVASNELGEFESGFTAQWFGAVPAAVIGGVGSLAIVLLWAFAFPELRDVDRLDAQEPLATT